MADWQADADGRPQQAGATGGPGPAQPADEHDGQNDGAGAEAETAVQLGRPERSEQEQLGDV